MSINNLVTKERAIDILWRHLKEANMDYRRETIEPLLQEDTVQGKLLRANVAAVLEALATAQTHIDAAQRLCEIYFNIAAKAIGEDAVRTQRDAMIDTIVTKNTERN